MRKREHWADTRDHERDNTEEYNAGVHFRRSGPREYHFHKRILSSDEWAK